MADDLADDRWTIRGIPRHVRDQASAAAQRAGVSVGIWAGAAFDHALRAEREPMDLTVPARAPDHRSDLPEGDPLATLERVIDAAVTLAGASDIPVRLRQRANRLLREMLPIPSTRAPVARQIVGPPAAEVPRVARKALAAE